MTTNYNLLIIRLYYVSRFPYTILYYYYLSGSLGGIQQSVLVFKKGR